MHSVGSARAIILRHCHNATARASSIEAVPILESYQRVLAEPIALDRDQPPFNRAMRDGFALRFGSLSEAPAVFKLVGELRAGQTWHGSLSAGEAIHIMTGAPVPDEADTVVMLEHTERTSEDSVRMMRPLVRGENVAPKGSERRHGSVVLEPGRVVGPLELAVLASVGKATVTVRRRPVVTILATGDEIVDVHSQPGPGQIRNTNSFSLYAQVITCGCIPRILETAPDSLPELRRQIELGLEADVLLVTGGVSMGKYDLVEEVLTEFGVQVSFDSVSMRPGKPTVFATRGSQWVFGLPGNPLSTFVAFELFVKPVLQTLRGLSAETLPLIEGALCSAIREKSGRTAFLPGRAISSPTGIDILPVDWKGSADICGASKANALMIVPLKVSTLERGDRIQALLFGELEYESEALF